MWSLFPFDPATPPPHTPTHPQEGFQLKLERSKTNKLIKNHLRTTSSLQDGLNIHLHLNSISFNSIQFNSFEVEWHSFHAQFWVQNFFGSYKIWVQKIFSPKRSRSKIIFGPKRILGLIIFGSKKISNFKKLWLKNSRVKKKLWGQNHFH